MTPIAPFLPGLSPVEGKALTAIFDGGRMSSDGGVIVLREIALRLGRAAAITKPQRDARDPTGVLHSYGDMALAPMMTIARQYATAHSSRAPNNLRHLIEQGPA